MNITASSFRAIGYTTKEANHIMGNICSAIPCKTITSEVEYTRYGNKHTQIHSVRSVQMDDIARHCDDKIATSNERPQINGEFWMRLKNDLQRISYSMPVL